MFRLKQLNLKRVVRYQKMSFSILSILNYARKNSFNKKPINKYMSPKSCRHNYKLNTYEITLLKIEKLSFILGPECTHIEHNAA